MSRALLRFFPVALAVLVMALSAALFIACQSRTGEVFALGGILFGAAMLLALLAWYRRSRKLGWAAAIAGGAWLILTGWIAVETPAGRAPAGAAVQHRYVGGRDGFRRYVLGNLVPEVDQFAVGFWLVPALDPLFTLKQGRMLSGLTTSIYEELEADPAFHALGSVMPEAYDELWQLPFDRGHYFLYIPPGLDRSVPRPALVFLHGSGGNFKAYTWLLSKVADELGLVLIAPSYGFGNWREPDTSRLVQAALDDAAKVVALDRKNVHLMGLSNGGLAVSQAGRDPGLPLRSLTFLSPVYDHDAITSRAFGEHWRGRPVLVISGGRDDRVPIDFVRAGVEMMREDGVQVTFQEVPDADHFMLFSHRAAVIRTITDWLKIQSAR